MESTKISDRILTSCITGICMGLTLRLTADSRGLFPKRKHYGWFKTRDDADQVLEQAQTAIDKYGRLYEEIFEEMCENQSYHYRTTDHQFRPLHTASWRTLDGFKVVMDHKSGRYMIRAPRPVFN